jgi:hypothetical protein
MSFGVQFLVGNQCGDGPGGGYLGADAEAGG